jgi:hypothetical protein
MKLIGIVLIFLFLCNSNVLAQMCDAEAKRKIDSLKSSEVDAKLTNSFDWGTAFSLDTHRANMAKKTYWRAKATMLDRIYSSTLTLKESIAYYESVIANPKGYENEPAKRAYLLAAIGYDLCLYRAEAAGLLGQSANTGATANPIQTARENQMEAARRDVQIASNLASEQKVKVSRERQGQRKTHNADAVAHQCVDLPDEGLFGGFENKCNFKIEVHSCNYRPKITEGGFNWSASFDCEKQGFGSYSVFPGKRTTAHTNNTELVYWFACKSPSFPADVEYVSGIGVRGRCW